MLLVHGGADTVVPIRGYHDATTALRTAGFEVSGHISPGLGHSVDQTGLALGAALVTRVLGPAE